MLGFGTSHACEIHQYIHVNFHSCLGQVVGMDKIVNAKEVAAVKDIAQRGVTMVATVHGTKLENLLNNPILNPLVGGKQSMIIGDTAAQ